MSRRTRIENALGVFLGGGAMSRIKTLIPAEPNRGRRHRDSTVKCWRRTVTAVPNPDATTGHDLDGDWLAADREADLEPGTLMVLHDFHGARVRVLLPTGAWFQLGGYVDEGGGWVQELRGRIRAMLEVPIAERGDACRKQWRALDPAVAAESIYPLLARPETAAWLAAEPEPPEEKIAAPTCWVDRWLLIPALRIAVEQYRRDAESAGDDARLAATFRKQADDAEAVANWLEVGEAIEIS